MALGAVQTAPNAADFKSLAEHQSQTPGTFFGGKPVLHLHAPNASVTIGSDDLAAQLVLQALQPATDGVSVNGGSAQNHDVAISGIDIWVTSEYVGLGQPVRRF